MSNTAPAGWVPKPRWKRYAAESGYVYEYVFQGFEHPRYIFRATSGPQLEVTIAIELDAEILTNWGRKHRPLTEIECYGIAKMALLRELDRRAHPEAGQVPVRPAFDEIEAICVDLDL